MRGAVRGVAFEQRQHGRQQEREEHAVGLGQVEALPGSVHDEKAEWIWGVLAELEAAGLVTFGRQGLPGQHLREDPVPGTEQAGTAEAGQ